MEPEPQRERSDEQWQHTAIDAARDRDWRRLRETVLPPGQPRMPDALLNARPEVRSMGVLHQLAFAGSDPGAEPTLRALVAAGCRFDPSVRSAATSADPAERSKTAPELARAQGFEALANLLAQLPDLPPAAVWRYRGGADEWLPFADSDTAIEDAWQAFRTDGGPGQLGVTEGGESMRVDLLRQRCTTGPHGTTVRIRRITVHDEASAVLVKTPSASLDAAPANFPKGLPDPDAPGSVTQFYWQGDDDAWQCYDAVSNAAIVAGRQAWKAGTGTSEFLINGMHSVELDGERPYQFQTADPSRVRAITHESAQWYWAGDPPDAEDGALPPWNLYTADQAAILEAAYRGGSHGAQIAHSGDVYLIDFSSMQQFRCTNRFHRRDVRRRGPKLKASGGAKLGAVEIEDTLPSYWQTDRSVLRAELASKRCEKHTVELPTDSSDFRELQMILDATMYQGPGPSAHDEGAGKGPHGSKFGLVPGCGRLPEPRPHGDPRRLELVKVERIENAFLWQRYAVRCADLGLRGVAETIVSRYLASQRPINHRLRCDERPAEQTVNEVYAFHGTSHVHVDKICHLGFDGRVPRAESDFGRAMYFAEHASKSNQYVDCPRCRKGSIPTKAKGPCNCTAEEVAATGADFKMILCRVALGNPRLVSALEYYKVDRTKRGSRDGWDGTGASGLNTVPTVPDPADLTVAELTEVLEMLGPCTGIITDEEVSIAQVAGRDALVALLERLEAQWRARYRLPAQTAEEQCDVVMSEARRAGGMFNLREFAVYDAALTYPEYVLHYRRCLAPEGFPPE